MANAENECASTCESCSDSSCSVKSSQGQESPEKARERMMMERRLRQIKNKILVMSGKGGVGKSSTAVNLAVSLAKEGYAVGLLDVDIHGPSVPKMLGLDKARPACTEEGLVPVDYEGMKVMSLGFMLEKEDDAIIWRGAMKHGAIQQFVRDVEWGPLDYLVVDCPPGTGDEPLSVTQVLGEGSKAVIVTTPQEVALLDVRKSITFCRQLNLSILGVVENMSGFCCPHCQEMIEIFKRGGGKTLSDQMEVPLLGQIPGDPDMVVAGDSGKPYVLAHPGAAGAKALRSVALEIISQTGERASKAS